MKIHISNQKGFSTHFLIPLFAILFIAGIGGYIMLRPSSAATLQCNNRAVTTSPVMCYVSIGKEYANKTYYSKTEIKVTKRTSSNRTVVISPKKITYTNVGSKHATVTTTPKSWRISCYTKPYTSGVYAKAPFYRDTSGTRTLTIPNNLDSCIILSELNYAVSVSGKTIEKMSYGSYISTIVMK